MTDDVRTLEKRQRDASMGMENNDPLSIQLGDVVKDPEKWDKALDQEIHYRQRSPASDMLIESRGYRRNRLRKILKIK